MIKELKKNKTPRFCTMCTKKQDKTVTLCGRMGEPVCIICEQCSTQLVRCFEPNFKGKIKYVAF